MDVGGHHGRCRNVARKFSIGGLCVCFRGLDIMKLTKTPLIYSVSHFSLWGLELCLGRISKKKSPVATGLGRRFVLRHTHRPQRRPYPICTSRSGNARHRCGGSWTSPRLFLGGLFQEGGYQFLKWKCKVLWAFSAHFAFHWWQNCSARMLLLSEKLLSCCASIKKTIEAGTKWMSRFEAPCICIR